MTNHNAEALAELPDDLDPEIAELVLAMNRIGLRTLGSCAGHGQGERGGPAARSVLIAMENLNVEVHNSCNCSGTGRQVMELRWGPNGPETTYQDERRLAHPGEDS